MIKLYIHNTVHHISPAVDLFSSDSHTRQHKIKLFFPPKLLMAAARPNDHISVLLEDNVGAVVKVKHRYRVELSRCATWLWHIVRKH